MEILLLQKRRRIEGERIGEYCREGITALIAVDAIDSDGY